MNKNIIHCSIKEQEFDFEVLISLMFALIKNRIKSITFPITEYLLCIFFCSNMLFKILEANQQLKQSAALIYYIFIYLNIVSNNTSYTYRFSFR